MDISRLKQVLVISEHLFNEIFVVEEKQNLQRKLPTSHLIGFIIVVEICVIVWKVEQDCNGSDKRKFLKLSQGKLKY